MAYKAGTWYDIFLKQLRQTQGEGARLEVDRLFEYVTGRRPALMRAYPEKLLSPAQIEQLVVLVQRRLRGEPLAYLIQSQGFWDLDLRVNAHTLIPRPETELLVQQILAQWDSSTFKRILDCGTGSGAIALALASERPSWEIWGVDISGAALAVARYNAERLGLSRVQFVEGDWFSPFKDSGLKFDCIVANPPYIAASDPHPHQGDCAFEPKGALIAGETGLECLTHLIQAAPQYVQAGGVLALEHGWDQQAAVLAHFRILCEETATQRNKHRLYRPRSLKSFADHAGQPRFVWAVVLSGRGCRHSP